MTPEPSSEDDDAEGGINIEVVDDPDSYIQTRRLKDIFEARKRVRDQRLKAKDHQMTYPNRAEEQKRSKRFYRAAIENYLAELRPLLLSDELGEHYWYKLDFGSLVIEPSTYEAPVADRGTYEKVDIPNGNGTTTYIVDQDPDAKVIDLTGLCCLFNLSEPITVNWEITVRARSRQKRTVVNKTEEVHIGFKKLDTIVNKANSYLQERGIELDPEEGLPEDELQL
jgi:hypothetical protein